MRKPRDFDAELRVLNEKAAQLKTRKVQQFGELVIATGADALTIASTDEPQKREAWATKGHAFFRGNTRTARQRPKGDNQSGAKGPDSDSAH